MRDLLAAREPSAVTRPAPGAYVVMAVLNVLAIAFVLRHWGEPRSFDGSAADQVLAVGVVLLLVALVWSRSLSPLRHLIAALMVLDTLRDAWTFSALSGQTPSVIGPINLAIEVAWLAGVAVLFFDRPAPRTSPETGWPSAARPKM